MNIQPVILCGGSGTRLWPLSREHYPKQLLRLVGDHSLLQATALRLDALPLTGQARLLPPMLVGNEEYRFLMAQQMQELGLEHGPILLEPCGRNTAPALTLAALSALETGIDDVILVVMPADHVIQDSAAFLDAVVRAIDIAVSGRIVTFGIVPSAPETEYGYIKVQGAAISASMQEPAIVERFVEKPDSASAEWFLHEGGYYWNSGLFVMRAGVWLSALERFRPDILTSCRQAHELRQQDKDFCRPDKSAFTACSSESIDYAVMEPLTQPGVDPGAVVVVPLDAMWSDVGAWNALWRIGQQDADRNVLMGDVMALDTMATLVIAQNRLVACVGLEQVVIVETADAVLVAHREKSGQLKDLVRRLKMDGRDEGRSHRKVYRPWGWYDSLDTGERFKVKRIVVNPGAGISLQMHQHRAEHWVVVSGTAKVTRAGESFCVSENESTYIPIGMPHRLENPGMLPLEIIEVQSGDYLGEDDIVRIDDPYGRPR